MHSFVVVGVVTLEPLVYVRALIENGCNWPICISAESQLNHDAWYILGFCGYSSLSNILSSTFVVVVSSMKVSGSKSTQSGGSGRVAPSLRAASHRSEGMFVVVSMTMPESFFCEFQQYRRLTAV
jgi:hypothetical protein